MDLFLGQMVVQKTDLVLPGRLPAIINRSYNPFEPFGAIAGFELGFGPGWALSIDVVLLDETASLRRLIMPGNARFSFVQQADGTFINTTHRQFVGAVLTATDQGGHLLRLKDGTIWRFAAGWLPPGRVVPIAGLGLLVEQRDRNENRLTIERDTTGAVLRIVEPAGRTLTLTHTDRRITEVRDPIGRTVRYGYDSARRLATVTDPADGVTRYTYDTAGRILTITDPRGITYLSNEYGAHGRVTRQTQADGGVWTFMYHRPCAPGESPPGAGSPGCLVTTSAESPTSVVMTDPRGNATTYRSSPNGFTSEVIDALGQVTQQELDARGQVRTLTDPLGHMTHFEYDEAGNIARIIDSLGNARVLTYDLTFNQVATVTDQLGRVTSFTYDPRGNPISITDPLGNVTHIAYDAFGQAISVSNALGNTTTLTYNPQGDVIVVSDPLGNTTSQVYDAASRLIERTNPLGMTIRFTYDVSNQLTQVVDALNGITAFTYDANGNLLEVRDALNHATTYEYDDLDRLIRRTDPLGASEFFAYDTVGNLILYTDRENQRTSFGYDSLNRRTEVIYADGTTTTFVYNVVGRLIQARDSVGKNLLYDYDPLGRLLKQTTELGTIEYSYNALGYRTAMRVPGQSLVTYNYDNNARLTQIVQGSQIVEIAYDALGRRARLTLPNGLSTEYSYDAGSHLIELIYRNVTEMLGNLTYKYDSAGNRTQIGGSFARTLLPDSIDSATYDASNRQLQFGNKQMTFDNNGNLTSITDPTGFTNFTWDAGNRLIGFTTPGVNATFVYDPLGRRSMKQINGQIHQYLYDGLNVVQETINNALFAYLQSLTVDELLIRNRTEYHLTDALGSTIALTGADGLVQTTYSYEPFGRTVVSGMSSNSFQYTGRESDLTGLYYYRARYYSPALHRFLIEDPLRFSSGDVMLYGYVSNNPTNFIDSRGQEKERQRPVSQEPLYYGLGGCCGDPTITIIGEDCSKRQPQEFAGCNAQQGACYEHDVCLSKAGRFGDLGNPAVTLCHLELCIDSTDPYIKGIFCGVFSPIGIGIALERSILNLIISNLNDISIPYRSDNFPYISPFYPL